MSDEQGLEKVIHLRNVELHWVSVEGEVVVLDERGELYLRTNGSGAKLWELLKDGASRSQLVDSLVTAYGITAERASSDVDAFLTVLAERAFLADP